MLLESAHIWRWSFEISMDLRDAMLTVNEVLVASMSAIANSHI